MTAALLARIDAMVGPRQMPPGATRATVDWNTAFVLDEIGRHAATLRALRVAVEALSALRTGRLKDIAGLYDITLAQFDPQLRRTQAQLDAICASHDVDAALAEIARLVEVK